MAMEAVALLKLPAAAVTEAIGHAKKAERARDPKVTALEDATLLAFRLPFSEEPLAMTKTLRALLGPKLGDHKDPRGVFVYPDVARPSATTYAAVLDEVGEAGFFLPTDEKKARAESGQAKASMEMPGMPGFDPALLQGLAEAAETNDPEQMARLGSELGNLLAKQMGLPDLGEMLRKAVEETNAEGDEGDEDDDVVDQEALTVRGEVIDEEFGGGDAKPQK